MRPSAAGRLLLACSLAFMPFFTVSWEIKMSDLEEKDVDEFSSSGFKCPTCFAVQGRKCDTELKWCAAGIRDVAVEMKRCIQADLCKETITS
uniref:UPAR/Ly6 domain-containing protein n=1 Tax=Pongo abelii TaxID=9601 RepID=A0A8I5TTS9_PONAB